MAAIRHLPVLLAAGYALALCCPAPTMAVEPTKAVVWQRDDPKHSSRADVWIANPDGSGAHRLVRGEMPDISPDGRWVAYTAETSTTIGLFVIPSSGGTPRVVFSDAGYSAPDYQYEYDWSIDSTKLAFGVGGDTSLVASYDVNTGQRGKSIGFVHPTDVAFVPGSDQIVIAAAGNAYEGEDETTKLLTMNIVDGTLRQFAEVKGDSADGEAAGSLVNSPTAVALTTSRTSSTSSPYDPLSSGTGFSLLHVDLASGASRTLGTGLSPIKWGADGLTLFVIAATCVKISCSFTFATIDSVTGVKRAGIGLGNYSIKRVVRRKHGKRRRSYRFRYDVLGPVAISSDGSYLLGQRFKIVGKRSASAAIQRTIERAPVSGAPAQVIAKGSYPDWNL